MNNFYELFEILPNASIKQIIMGYENKITKYNNLKKLTKEQVYEIKKLKIGLHILINPNLRKKYNDSVKQSEPINLNKQSEPSEPQAINSGSDDTLDSLFNIDNSWMEKINNESTQLSKRKLDINSNDRVFSLSELNKRPGFSSDFESELRKPLQGREDKSSQMVNKNKM
jgi:hypothetical protein